MEQASRQQSVNKTTFQILVALSVTYCLNDSLQSTISAVYPLFKNDLALSFAQIRSITLVYQLSVSVFQPMTGLVSDKHLVAWSLPVSMSFTLVGLLNLTFSSTLHWVLISVFLIDVGSSVLHPEASRITSLASGGRRGLAQSPFQVGSNLGGSLGLLLVALLVAPYGRTHVALFSILAFVATLVTIPTCRWYEAYPSRVKWQKKSGETRVEMPLSLGKTVFSISILLTLVFSKYIYMASLSSCYTFYLIHKFEVSVQTSQIYLFILLIATAIGTLAGDPIGDRIGRRYVIWRSILRAALFSLLMPHVGFVWTIVLSFCMGLVLSSAFPAILLYAQELFPYRLGLISGFFFGFAFGVAGIASAVLGNMASHYRIETVYNICGFIPLLRLVTWFLPNLKKK